MAKVQKLSTSTSSGAISSTGEAQYTRYGRRYLECWNIIDGEGNRRPVWTRLGYAFENRDGSWNVELNAFPANMKLHLRNPLPREQREAQAEAA